MPEPTSDTDAQSASGLSKRRQVLDRVPKLLGRPARHDLGSTTADIFEFTYMYAVGLVC